MERAEREAAELNAIIQGTENAARKLAEQYMDTDDIVGAIREGTAKGIDDMVWGSQVLGAIADGTREAVKDFLRENPDILRPEKA